MKDKDIPFTVDWEDSKEESDGKASAKDGKATAKRTRRAGSEGDQPKLTGREGSEGTPTLQNGGVGASPTMTVSQLTRRIKGMLEEALPLVLVEGELSNVKKAASGHVYFNLKDATAQIRCVMFRGAAASLRFDAEDGLQVMLRGRVTVFESRGEYQIQVIGMEPLGTGALQLAFDQMKRRLEAEGLFDPARKKPLPFLPRRIGVVTSPTGAAIRDMLHVLERRFPGMPVLIYPATVQGEKAAGEITEGIRALDGMAASERIDVIIVGRGGGSVEDLWAFNEEPVARAIFDCTTPVISAVGHEVDFTIADFVADVRAPTPSVAAELAVPNRADLRYTVESLRERLFQRVAQDAAFRKERLQGLRARLGSPEGALQQMAQRVDGLNERVLQAGRGRLEGVTARLKQGTLQLLLLRPDRFHKLHAARVKELEARLSPAMQRKVGGLRQRLEAGMELLSSLSPLTVLDRGYAVARAADGALLRSVKQVKPGDSVSVRLADGTVNTEVKTVDTEVKGTQK